MPVTWKHCKWALLSDMRRRTSPRPLSALTSCPTLSHRDEKEPPISTLRRVCAMSIPFPNASARRNDVCRLSCLCPNPSFMIDTYPAAVYYQIGRIMHMPTRLEQFIRSRGIKPAHLARESGYSRQHLLRIRMGRMEPTRRCIAAIVAACRRLSREAVKPTDLFDLEGDP